MPEDEERARKERASIRRLETVLQTAPDSAPEDGSGDDDESSAVGALPSRREAAPLSKIAVIHIDGNGVGGVMRDLAKTKDSVDESVFKKEVSDWN